MADHGADGDHKLTEERLALLSVLQELTVAALDLLNPCKPADNFLDRVAERLGCAVALWLQPDARGQVGLLGASGLSSASRQLPIPGLPPRPGLPAPLWVDLPYPELDSPGLVRWSVPIDDAGPPPSLLLLYFDREPNLPRQYRGMVERLGGVLRTALVHRQLFARTLDSERALQRERDFSSAVLDTARALVIVLDPQGRIIRFNRACQEVTGYSFEELRGAYFWMRLLPPDEAARVEQNFAVLAAGLGFEQYETHWVTRWGERRLISWSSNVLRGESGAIEYVIGTGIDITEHRRAEHERDQIFHREQQARARAEEQEGRSALLAEASGLLTGSLAPEDALRSVAALTVERFADWCAVDLLDGGYSFQRITEARSEALRATVPARMHCALPDLDAEHGPGRVLREGEPEFCPEGCASMSLGCVRDGQGLSEVVEFQSWISVPLLAREHALGALTLARMAGGGRYGPADFALAQELARRAAMALDNARLYQQAQLAIGLRDEFLSIASHELKTPVTSLQLSVQGLTRLARAGALGITRVDAVTHSLEVIERQAKRMAKLVNTLLDVSRIQAGKLELEFEEVDLAALVRDVAARFAPELATSGTRLQVHADTAMPGVWDRSRLDQIVTNLLSNAIKYGEGRPIEVRVEGDAVMARLEVRDQGIGIPAERHARIFRAFERAVSSRHYGGLGLGLHIVNQLVERLGGSVRVESEAGQGATFTVELPRRGPHAAPSADPTVQLGP
ncbi:sensory box histidine kinase [Corallococcus coralloides DSM 2259]|uniref:histidine kinase n=1 Tax=Corallococcus coralloides (strain ATCC 25202 / DSM 2259 / NBRC 100086 / M2) TaxID=1144275 RepID=H8MXM1_CORCM|nr:ATP-binding protein [Corallococcus coralloides]AFE08174.1 sensory box histidine kinase [Corallococcus coralloides DSM 2259]